MSKKNRQIETRPRRRWIIIGPGIVIALILAVQVWINYRTQASEPPIIERQVISNSASKEFTPAPEISSILKRRDELNLSEQQVEKLERLQAEWDAKSRPLEAEMDKASAEFRKYMDEAEGKVSMQEVQSRGAAVSELSRQLSSLRRVYWEKAQQVYPADRSVHIDGHEYR